VQSLHLHSCAEEEPSGENGDGGDEVRWLRSRVEQLELELATVCEWIEKVQRITGHNPYRSPYRAREALVSPSQDAPSSRLSDVSL